MAINIEQTPSMTKAPAFTRQHAAKYLQRGFKALLARDFEEAWRQAGGHWHHG